MFKSLFLIFKQFLGFLALLIIGKVIFMLYHFNHFSSLIFSDKIGVFFKGIKLDLSISAYLIIIPFLLHIFFLFTKTNSLLLRKICRIYFLIFCILISCIIVVDLELFRTWGFRIDKTPLRYLVNTAESLASISGSPFHILVPILFLLFVVLFQLSKNIFNEKYWFNTKNILVSFLVHLLVLASLIIPIRGGLQLAPINQSSVYFSKNNFANQAAINPVFNLFYSISNKTDGENPFEYLPKKEAKIILDSLFLESKTTENQLSIDKPNVLLITWESLTFKALGQKKEVLPNFKKLIDEGVFFSNCYASGDRSDKGMVAILSGYPAQPITSIISFPQKTAKLPVISIDLKKNGYSTSWYYGGEPEFANIKSYLLHGDFDEIISKENFPKEYTIHTKWGANDSIVFNRLAVDLPKMKQPFFVNYFTLSSHEPFEVANNQIFIGKDETSKFLNSHNYTDAQLGRFIEIAKKQDWYKNTIIIITADHGHRLPNTKNGIEEFHIPMLWFGGALKATPKVISQVTSQNDIAKTLLNQLKITSSAYVWSKDFFAKNYKPFAYFSFNNGFGLVQNHKSYRFDNTGKMIIERYGNVNEADIKTGKAFVQSSFADYLLK